MNITWIIGNGFDLNLKLNTGYGYFVNEVYLPKDSNGYSHEKQRFVDAVNDLPEWGTDKWSDLEALAGKVTASYKLDEREEYEIAFLDMLELMRQHLITEERRAKDLFSCSEIVNEAWASITSMDKRLTPREYDRLGNFQTAHERNNYDFISLNYTRTLDMLIEAIKQKHNPFGNHVGGSTKHDDSCRKLIHLHGTLEEEGGIVFGLSNAEQIENEEFASDEDFTETWVKQRRNGFFGNTRNADAMAVIQSTSVFVIYGCSLGATDEYIWQAVVNRLEANGTAAVVFSHEMPRMGTLRTWECQKKRNQIRDKLLSYCDLETGTRKKLESKIVVANSGLLFRFNED